MSRMLFFTGLRVPLLGRAPRDGKRLMESLAKRYPSANLTCHSWSESVDAAQLLDDSPLVLMGHSFGGSTAVWLAEALRKRHKPVEEMLLLDPVPTDFGDRWRRKSIEVPDNVKLACCIARPNRWYPRSKTSKGSNVSNELRAVAHDHFLRDPEIVARIENLVKRHAQHEGVPTSTAS